MRRLVPSGTPSRTNRYVYPENRTALFLIPLLAGIALGGALLVLVFSGARPIASPGALSTSHAPFEKNCAACHGPRIADARCERCHDPSSSGRLQNAGHIWFGTRNRAAVVRAATLECGQCHTDHRGRTFSIAREDDRQCRGCHFSSLSAHPEFGLVKSRVQTDEGLQFSHKKHLKAVQKAKLDDCQYCHELTRDRRGFQPPNFDQQCSRCHLKGGSLGSTDPIAAEGGVILPQDIDAPWAKSRSRAEPDARGRFIVPKLAHKDPWVLFNLWKISRELDPDGAAARRAQLEQRIGDLMSQLGEQGRAAQSREALRLEEARLAHQVVALERQPAKPSDRLRMQRALSRVRVQLELGPAPLAAIHTRARTQLEEAVRQLRSDLASLGPVGQVSLSEEDKRARRDALAAVAAPCLVCHVLDGAWRRTTRLPDSLLSRTNFNHLPHLQQLPCQGCHVKIAESRKAEDVNLPGVRSCQTCHRSGRSRSDCAECHRYHPAAEPWPPI